MSDNSFSLAAGKKVRIYEDQATPRRVALPEGRIATELYSRWTFFSLTPLSSCNFTAILIWSTGSNFCLVALASDESLWALGLGEYDRNGNPYFIRVETDFHSPPSHPDPTPSKHFTSAPTTSSSSTSSSITSDLPTVFVRVPPSAKLRKGHRRVSVLYDREAADSPSLLPSAGDFSCFEVVLHMGEAYLLEADLDRCPGAREKLGADKYRLIDYSVGWQHSLLIAEPDI